jgi:hypothetical protein
VDIAKTEANAIAHQDMTTVIETGTTEIVTETEIATEIATGEADGMTDVSRLARDIVVAPEIMMTIRDVLPIMKMTAAVTFVATAMETEAAAASEEEEVAVAAAAAAVAPLAKTDEMGSAADVENKTRTV